MSKCDVTEIVFQTASEMYEKRNLFVSDVAKIRVIQPLRRNDAERIKFLKSYAYKIDEIHFPADGDIFSSEDGKYVMGRRKDGTMILLFSTEKNNVVIPDGTKIICEKAFATSRITEVLMPDSVEFIETWAFYSCKNLEKVRLSQNLRVVAEYAFFGCDSLKEAELPDSLEIVKNEVFESMRIRINEPLNRHTGGDLVSALSSIDEETGFFCVSYEGRNIVFPKNMTFDAAQQARRILCGIGQLPPGTYTHHELTYFARCKLNTMLFGYSISPDPKLKTLIKDMLRRCGRELIANTARKGEDVLLQLVDFLGGEFLTDSLRRCILDTAAEYDMVSVTARCLQYCVPDSVNKCFCL